MSFSITVIQVCAQTTNVKKAEVDWFYEQLQDLELTPPKYVLFIIEDWNAKVGSQEIPGVTGKLVLEYKMKKAKANTVLSREHTGHSKQSLQSKQETTLHVDITRWSIPNSN